MNQQQVRRTKEQDKYYYLRLKYAFEQQNDIYKFKFSYPCGQADRDFNSFVKTHIEPYIMARKAINNLSENLRQRKNRSKDTLSNLYSFAKSATNSDQVMYNMKYFLSKEEQVVVAKKKLEGLLPKQNELDLNLPLAKLVETIVKRVNVYATFIKYNGEAIRNQRGLSSTNKAWTLYNKQIAYNQWRDIDTPLFEQIKLIESLGIKKQMIISRKQFDKMMFPFKTKFQLHDKDHEEIFRIITDELYNKLKDEQNIINWIKKIKRQVEINQQLPSQYELKILGPSALQKAFFDLLSTIRKVFSQHYSRVLIANRQKRYYPKDGVQYDRIVNIIQNIYQKMTKNAYQNKIGLDKQVEQVEKQIANHRIQNHKNVATHKAYFKSLINSQFVSKTIQLQQPKIDVQELLFSYNSLLEKQNYYDSLEEELIQLIQTFRTVTKPNRSQTVINQQRSVDMKSLIEIKKYIQQSSAQEGNQKIKNILFNENQRLKTEKGKLTSQLMQTKQQLDSFLMNSDQTINKKEVDALNSKLEVKKTELEEAKRFIIKLKAQNQANLKQKERLIKQLQQSQVMHMHFKEKSTEQQNQIHSLRGQLNTNSNTSHITKQCQKLLADLQTICQEKTALITNHQQTIQQLNQQIITFKSTINDMERQDRQKTTRQQIKYHQMSHAVGEKEKIIQEKSQELRNVQSSLEWLKKENILLQNKLEKVQYEKNKNQEKLMKKELEFATFIDQTLDQIQSKSTTIQTQQTQISQFEKQITQLKGQLERYKRINQQKNQILSSNQKMTRIIKSIQAAKQQISDELEKSKAEIKKKEEQLNTKQKQIHQLKEKTDMNTNKISQLQQQLHKLQQKNKKSNEKLSEIKMKAKFAAQTLSSDIMVVPYSRSLFSQDIFLKYDKGNNNKLSAAQKQIKNLEQKLRSQKQSQPRMDTTPAGDLQELLMLNEMQIQTLKQEKKHLTQQVQLLQTKLKLKQNQLQSPKAMNISNSQRLQMKSLVFEPVEQDFSQGKYFSGQSELDGYPKEKLFIVESIMKIMEKKIRSTHLIFSMNKASKLKNFSFLINKTSIQSDDNYVYSFIFKTSTGQMNVLSIPVFKNKDMKSRVAFMIACGRQEVYMKKQNTKNEPYLFDFTGNQVFLGSTLKLKAGQNIMKVATKDSPYFEGPSMSSILEQEGAAIELEGMDIHRLVLEL